MPLLIPPGFGQVAWRWELNGDPEYIWTTCGVNLGTDGGAFQAACDELDGAMRDAYPAAQMSNQWRYRGCVLRVGQDGSPPIVFETISNIVGTGGATILPQNCAMLVRKITASAGRRNRGRFYFPILGILEGAVDQVGAINSSDITAQQARLDVLRASMVAGPVATPPVILHTSGGHSPAGSPTAITSFALEPKIATQRRRMRR